MRAEHERKALCARNTDQHAHAHSTTVRDVKRKTQTYVVHNYMHFLTINDDDYAQKSVRRRFTA